MKTLPLLFLLSWYCWWCKGTVIFKVKDSNNKLDKPDEKTFLYLNQDIIISYPLTFCIQFNLKSGLVSIPIFSSSKLTTLLRFEMGTGRVILNEDNYLFNIPQDHGISPYSWHHLCWKSDGKMQEVVVDGQNWYNGTIKPKSYKKSTINQFLVGSVYGEQFSDLSFIVDFQGELSGLNIWNKALTSKTLKKITSSCENPEPIPDVLDWSEITSSMLKGHTYEKDIQYLW